MRDRDGNECTPNAAPDASDEFARGSDVWPDDPGGATRRSFLKRMAAALALAGVGGVGCSSRPEGETIVPYVDLPDGMVPGLPMTFASAMSFNGFARGVLVTTREGRPIKVDGNPDHPSSLGGSDAFVQASILDLYDPTRANAVTFAGQPVDWSQAFAAIDDRVALAATSGGVGLRVLTGATSSPTLIAQLESLLERMPHARWHRFEPLETGAAADGAMAAFGRPADVVYDFAHASVVVALDADFLVEGPGSLRYARDFATGRRVRDGRVTMNRLYVAEGSLTTTGARADHRLPCAPSAIADVAAALAWACGVEAASDRPTATSPDPDGRLARWASAVAVDLLAHRGTSIVLPGASQPPHVHTLAHQINAALGNVGTTVRYVEPIARSTVARGKGSLAGLVAAIDAGEVTTLLILADDPAHAAPADVDFADALAKLSKARRADGSLAHFTAHLSARPNATSYACQWHLPEAHYLEAWGDVRGHDGTASIVQPTIAPLFNGKAACEIVDRLLGLRDRGGYAIVRERWSRAFGDDDFEARWRDALKRGIVEGTASMAASVTLASTPITPPGRSGERADGFELCLRPDPSAWDGSFVHNAWLQELPRPFTKIVWDQAVAIGVASAKRAGVETGDLVRVTLDDRWVELPAVVLPGTPDGTLTLPFGYGKRAGPGDADVIGANVFGLRTADAGYLRGASLRKLDARHDLVQTRSHFAMAAADFDVDARGPAGLKPRAVITSDSLLGEPDPPNRRLVRATTLSQWLDAPDVVRTLGGEAEKKPLLSLYPQWDYSAGYQWGMSIDQTACIGCNACVVACQAENNIPVVGKDQVGRQREMHWLRIDDYFAGTDAENPRVHQQPVPCMHCENAPCEVVCPVAATTHSVEGLNQMTYNRCVGTRYCSNNCPYKVRRFNFLDYTQKLRQSRTERLGANPEVTIPARGVMEKCSYCIQRLQQTRIVAERVAIAGREAARKANDDGERRRLADDAAAREFDLLDRLDTACAQACPTRAITFGSILPIAGKPTRLMAEKRQSLDYVLLRELTTRPRTSYLARVTNPDPAMAAVEKSVT